MLRKSRSQRERSSPAIRGRRMRRKSTGDKARFLLVLRFQLLKHRGHRTRIVACGVHVLNAEFVRFLFRATAKLHEDAEQSDAGRVLINHPWNAAQED